MDQPQDYCGDCLSQDQFADDQSTVSRAQPKPYSVHGTRQLKTCPTVFFERLGLYI